MMFLLKLLPILVLLCILTVGVKRVINTNSGLSLNIESVLYCGVVLLMLGVVGISLFSSLQGYVNVIISMIL